MNDIDTLMARVDEINSRQPPYTNDDIETIILYHRTQRQRRASGKKPERQRANLEELLGSIMAKPAPAKPSPFSTRRL